MKPLHIVLLVVAGAVGGAIVMKVAQKPQPAPTPVVAQTQAPAPVPAAEPVAAAEPAKPAAFPEPKEAPKPQRVRRAPQGNPEPVAAVQSPPPAPAVAPPAEPPKETPPPPPTPPARTEPENVTPPPPPPPPPEPHKVTLNAGTLIPVRLVDGLSSERNMPGDTFTATLDKELVVDGFVIAERGARADGRVVASDRGGRVKGVAGIAVELTRIHTSDGQKVAIQTDSFERHAQQARGQDAAKVGTGAAIGAAIGAIAGGGKGAAIGAGVGGAAGAGDVMMTRGQAARLPSETRINFRLRAAVTLTERQ